MKLSKFFFVVLLGLVPFFLLNVVFAQANEPNAEPSLKQLASPLVVNSTSDDGDFNAGDGTCETGIGNGICTLRAAIEESNADTSITHTIEFNISGSGPHTITPDPALPNITHPVIIDGLTQTGADCNTPQIEIDGSNVEAIVNITNPLNPKASDIVAPTGLNLNTSNSTILGLAINNFDKAAVFTTVTIDQVGFGILIDDGDNNYIACNFIGTEPDGNTASPNQIGISIVNSNNNVITGNLVSGNGNNGRQTAGILIGTKPDNGLESIGNQITNNYIGTDKTGLTDLGNQQDGILLINAKNTLIQDNVIASNGDDGVDISDLEKITIMISLASFESNWVCTTPPCTTGNMVYSNTIGLNKNGAALGNGDSGVEIKNGEQNTVSANTIAYNGRHGVEINELTTQTCTGSSTPCTVSNTISHNSIYSNDELGIDLVTTGDANNSVNLNGSSTNGPNRLQNYPVLSSTISEALTLTMSGSLTGTNNHTFVLEFFANDTCDASGYGEGQTYLISDTITTDGSGEAMFAVQTPSPDEAFIVATATDEGGNTSEFSACAEVTNAMVVTTYTLSLATVGNGSVNPVSGVYTAGTEINLTATPDSGWLFQSWSGDLTSSTNPEIVTMDSNKTITATFVEASTVTSYTLDVSIVGNGLVSPMNGTYISGTIALLTATPDNGWLFEAWSGDLLGSLTATTVTMDSNKMITATFTANVSRTVYLPAILR
ncbi:MAG: right-handed parallel beta-helix repeat-containing protein [Chloroflexota bacterium]